MVTNRYDHYAARGITVNDVIVLIGTAPCAKDDLKRFKDIHPYECDYMAVGVTACQFQSQWDYVVTGHAEDIPSILELTSALIIHYEYVKGVDFIQPWDIRPPTGSSAHLGALAAITLNYNKIILCGCPMSGENPKYPGYDYSMFQQRWIDTKDQLIKHVRSMSGFTKNLLGEPTKEWIND